MCAYADAVSHEADKAVIVDSIVDASMKESPAEPAQAEAEQVEDVLPLILTEEEVRIEARMAPTRAALYYIDSMYTAFS